MIFAQATLHTSFDSHSPIALASISKFRNMCTAFGSFASKHSTLVVLKGYLISLLNVGFRSMGGAGLDRLAELANLVPLIKGNISHATLAPAVCVSLTLWGYLAGLACWCSWACLGSQKASFAVRLQLRCFCFCCYVELLYFLFLLPVLFCFYHTYLWCS